MDDFANEARVFDGARWDKIRYDDDAKEGGSKLQPVPPSTDGDGHVFVSVVSYRDSKRCGKTLKSIFEQARDSSNIIVGLVDQVNTEDDEASCMKEFCKLMGKFNTEECQYSNQVRVVGLFTKGAAGPGTARALQRKNLGNEEFCLQVDSHSDFSKDWDVLLKEEWLMAQNEYAVISTVPPSTSYKAEYETGGTKAHQVPRICQTSFTSIKLPTFTKNPRGIAEHLTRPLLAHGWCAGFSFHKCHLEEAAPYDYFLPQIFDGEEFPRYARLWTRGYDVYTPTKNLVFHDEGPNPDGHDMKGWPRRDLLRNKSLQRIKTVLEMREGDGSKAHANLGLLGLGKRRSLSQLEEFVGIDLNEATGGKSSECGFLHWVPYDHKLSSAMDNLYDHPEDLDPQPEFPLRTAGSAIHEPGRLSMTDGSGMHQEVLAAGDKSLSSEGMNRFVLFILWCGGLALWFFFSTRSNQQGKKKHQLRSRRPIAANAEARKQSGDEQSADGHKTV